MLDLKKFNFKRIASTIGNMIDNDISSRRDVSLIGTIQNYKFGFIATIEALEDRDLTPREVIAIHNKFFSKAFITYIVFKNDNIYGLYEKERHHLLPESRIEDYEEDYEDDYESQEFILATEATKKWGLSESTIRRAIFDGRIKEMERKKEGRDWKVSILAIKRLYGEPKLN